MQPLLDVEIRECLARYLGSEIALAEFQERFVPMAWDIENLGSWPTEELVSDIELALAEFSNGHWTEQQLKDLLRVVLERYTMAEAPEPRTSSSSAVIPDAAAGVTYQLSSAGIQS